MIVYFRRVSVFPEHAEPNTFLIRNSDNNKVKLAIAAETGEVQIVDTEEIIIAVEWSAVSGKPATFPPSAHNHNDVYFTKNEMNTTLGLKADLVGGKIPSAQLPGFAIGERFTVANQAAMLALAAQQGDVAIRTDLSNAKFLLVGDATVLANWINLSDSAGDVTSVNGHTGPVVLSKEDLNLENVPNVNATLRSNHDGTQDASTITGMKTAAFISNFAATVLAATLTGISFATDAAITAGDSILVAFGKLQAQINSIVASKADKANVARTFTGTTETIVATDLNKELRASNASAKTVTIPATATLGINFVCAIYNYGAGALSFSPASGVTLRPSSGTLAQYKTVTIRAVGADEYQITGELQS